MFVGPQTDVYQGMVIGEHSRDNDLEVNSLRGKKLTNVRANGSDDAVALPHTFSFLWKRLSLISTTTSWLR